MSVCYLLTKDSSKWNFYTSVHRPVGRLLLQAPRLPPGSLQHFVPVSGHCHLGQSCSVSGHCHLGQSCLSVATATLASFDYHYCCYPVSN